MKDYFQPEALQTLIEEYASFGIHRTGWPADDRCSDWLLGWLEQFGVEPGLSEFTFPYVETRAAYVEAEGALVQGTPLHDGGATPPGGVRGPVVAGAGGDLAGRIAVVRGPQELAALLDAPAEGRPAAVIAVSGDPEGNVLLRNAEAIDHPHELPVIQVALKDAGPIEQALASGAEVSVVLDFTRSRGTATNVVGRLPANGTEAPIMITTPKSGWFTCAAERGGGLAITLALAAHLARSASRRREVLFLFTSGHEINYYGMLEHLKANPDLRERVHTWVQLGASIGARNQPAWRVFSRDETLRKSMSEALERQGLGPVTLAPVDQRPGGEAREVFDRRFLALAGGHPYFHSPRDIPEVAVDAERVARFGLAFRELVDGLVG
ncbi:MAG TPA: hypothetical protein VNN10_10600 [Dehalococcoidia bacterium]|nr:hypothetical protein [Dehalococcoidia bacterium]